MFPPPPPPAFLRDRMMDGMMRDYEYYDRREEYARDMYERRYPPMLRSRDSRYMERPYPIPPMPRDYGPSREMFTRRSPPRRGFGIYEDFSRDSFDDRRGGGMRGMSPTHRYAPY